MALQDDLGAAISAIADAKNALNTIAAQATSAIASVGNAYAVRLATLTASYYVNQITGSDSNPGTADLPLKTIKAALNKVPFGGNCDCLLQSDVTIDEFIEIRGKNIYIRSASSSVRAEITFVRSRNTNYSPNSRELFSFRLRGSASVVMQFVRITMPELSGFGSWGDLGEAVMFAPISNKDTGPQFVGFNVCEFNIPSTPFGAIIMDNWPVGLQVTSCTLVGDATSFKGRVVRGQTDTTTGVPAGNHPAIYTNLSTL